MKSVTLIFRLIALFALSACESNINIKLSPKSTVIASGPSVSYSGATGVVGGPLSVSPIVLEANGAAITSCASSPALPAWASIHPSTCVITGTPSATFVSSTYTITATNSVGSSSATVTLTVNAGVPVLGYSGSTGTTGTVGSAMTVTPTALNHRGAPITSCTASPALPSGLSIDPLTCVISGTPTVGASSTAYTITATNSVGSTSASVTLSASVSARLAFQTTQNNSLSNSCIGPFIIGLKDDAGLFFTTIPSVLTVNLNDNSVGTSSFHLASDCTDSPVSTVTILAGESLSNSVYFKTSGSGNITLTANDPSGTVSSVNHSINVVEPVPDTWVGYAATGVPTSRRLHSATWTGSEMIIWGGRGSTRFNTGGRYNPVTDTWERATSITGAPLAREGHSAIWTGSEVIIWGGLNGSGLNTGARYNPVTDTWGAATSTIDAVSARSGHSAIWTGSEMIVWGGISGGTYLNTGGRYNPQTDTWGAETSTTVAPLARQGHSAIWTGTEMIIWGGSNGSWLDTGGRYNPVTDTWGGATSTTDVIAAREDHSAIWTGTEMIIWGGKDGLTSYDTGGRYNPTTDTWGVATITTGAPSARSSHSAIWTGSEMIVWGGQLISSSSTDTGGRYDPLTNSWASDTSTTQVTPYARANHSAIWTGSEMIIWGGFSLSNVRTNTGGRFNPVTNTWGIETSTIGAPSARYNHSAIWTGSEIIIWGGQDVGSRTNTGGRYDPVTDTWAATSTTGAPDARFDHSAIWTGSEMIIWGGFNTSRINTGGRYDPGADTWGIVTSTTGAPTARQGHTGIWTGSEMIIWGGYDGSSTFNTGHRYDPDTDTWGAETSTTGASFGRHNHSAVWTGTEMIIWGGVDGSNTLTDTGGRYNPVTDTWGAATQISGAPIGRKSHSAIWTGSEMIIWGGERAVTTQYNDMYYFIP